jgi:rare lipoprotein A
VIGLSPHYICHYSTCASCVIAALPDRIMAKQSTDIPPVEDSSQQDRHQLRVLLVEDGPVQQMAISHLLKHLGHNVTVAGDGFQALAEVQRDNCYDVILMDCRMPLMDGFQATRLIRQAERITGQQTAIIGIGAASSPDECFMAGMDDFLSKPLNKMLVKEVLGRWIRENKIHRSASRPKDSSLIGATLLVAILSLAPILPVSAQSTKPDSQAKPSALSTISAKLSAKAQKAFPPKLLSGIASWYGKPFHGRRTASGQIYDMNKLTAAHPTLPLSSQVLVKNPHNGKVVVITVTDRGPYFKNRVIDLSREAAKQLGILSSGIAYVTYSVLPSPGQVVNPSSPALDDQAINAVP